MTRKFDWLLGAAFLAAPFYWWVLTLFVNSTSEPSADTKRLLLLVIVYPILEEIVFRGALQEILGLAASFWRYHCKYSDQHRIRCISSDTTAQYLVGRGDVAGPRIRIFSRSLRQSLCADGAAHILQRRTNLAVSSLIAYACLTDRFWSILLKNSVLK